MYAKRVQLYQVQKQNWAAPPDSSDHSYSLQLTQGHGSPGKYGQASLSFATVFCTMYLGMCKEVGMLFMDSHVLAPYSLPAIHPNRFPASPKFTLNAHFKHTQL